MGLSYNFTASFTPDYPLPTSKLKKNTISCDTRNIPNTKYCDCVDLDVYVFQCSSIFGLNVLIREPIVQWQQFNFKVSRQAPKHQINHRLINASIRIEL